MEKLWIFTQFIHLFLCFLKDKWILSPLRIVVMTCPFQRLQKYKETDLPESGVASKSQFCNLVWARPVCPPLGPVWAYGPPNCIEFVRKFAKKSLSTTREEEWLSFLVFPHKLKFFSSEVDRDTDHICANTSVLQVGLGVVGL